MSWSKTRYCKCNYCRFHSTSEPGWETCPDADKKNVKGRWLWIKSYSSSVDLEHSDKVYLKEQIKNATYEDSNVD